MTWKPALSLSKGFVTGTQGCVRYVEAGATARAAIAPECWSPGAQAAR
jgi:hypothetical protein